jgi:hypothetical protein
MGIKTLKKDYYYYYIVSYEPTFNDYVKFESH